MFVAGAVVEGQHDNLARSAVIVYNQIIRQFVYYARRWNSINITLYICQLQQGLLTFDDIQSNITKAFYIFY